MGHLSHTSFCKGLWVWLEVPAAAFRAGIQPAKAQASAQLLSNISPLPPVLPLPFQVELEVLEDGSARQEGTAEARQDLPAVQVAHTARVGHLIGLLDELAVHFVPQRPQVVPRLQDALDDGDGVGHGLQLLERIEYLDSFILEGCVAFVFEH